MPEEQNLGSGIGGRISAVAARIGGRHAAAEAAGVSADSLQRYIRGEVKPAFETIARLGMAAGISLDWLATGCGTASTADNPCDRAATHAPDDYVKVPSYDVLASAGPGAVVHSEQIVDFLAFRADWLRAAGLRRDALALIEAVGDSMEPTIRAGDLLLVDLSRHHPGEGIHILRVDDQLLAKRLQVAPSGSLYIKSDNPAYSTLEVAGDESLSVLGRVAWTIRRV